MANGRVKLIDIEHEDAILMTFILLVQTAQAVLKYTDTYLYRKTGLSTVKFIVLQALSVHNGVMMPSRIAEWTQTERHNITALIKRMRQEGLVTTERDANDRRIVNVILTDKGKDVLRRALPKTRAVIDQVMSSITESDAAMLRGMLSVLRQNADNGLRNLVKHLELPTRDDVGQAVD